MAEIIRAATLSAVSRPLRRPGSPPMLSASTVAVVAGSPVGPLLPVSPTLPEAMMRQAWGPERAEQEQEQEQEQERVSQLEQIAHLRQSQRELADAAARLAEGQRQLAQQQQQVQDAQQQLKEAAGQARTEAERLGYEQGRERAERDALAASAEQVARLNAVVQVLTQSKRTLLDDNEDMLVELAFAAVCRMLGASAASRAGLAAMVNELVAAEREAETLRVRLHPQDLEQLGGVPGIDARVSFQADSGIELGGCIMDGPRGTLDARLELQIEHLRAALLIVRQQRKLNEAPV
jgi:flagellar assembly protein FliH